MIVLDYRDKRPLNEQVAEKIMKGVPAEDLRHDIRLSPGWVRELLWGYLPVRGGGGVPER